MAEYYLISQLPSLDGLGENTPIPITEGRYLELCSRLVSKKTLREIEALTLTPPMDAAPSCSALVNEWNAWERDLRLALAKVRAEKRNKPFELNNKFLPQELSKAASAAAEIENPLEAENFLLQYRLNFLESLRPMDTFSEEFLFYYALKLKLIQRIREFDTALGKAAYKSIYHSILNGSKSEA